jgi:hypothetical protein
MKYSVSINLTMDELQKDRIKHHTNGKHYLNLYCEFDPDNPGQYGDHGFITHSSSAEERNEGYQSPIVGNIKVLGQYGNAPKLEQSAKKPRAKRKPFSGMGKEIKPGSAIENFFKDGIEPKKKKILGEEFHDDDIPF